MAEVDFFQLIRRDMDGPALVARLAHVPNIHLVDGDGQSLLHVAIAYEKPQAAIALLQSGITPNVQDSQGMTPLHYCIGIRNGALPLDSSLGEAADEWGHTRSERCGWVAGASDRLGRRSSVIAHCSLMNSRRPRPQFSDRRHLSGKPRCRLPNGR